jgi:hypothetical protein
MRWQWLLIGVLGLIGAAVVVVYIVVSSYDFNALKPWLVQTVKEHTGQELTLGGDLAVQFGLTPALGVENVSLHNAPWGSRPELATLKRLEIQVALVPLIRGELVFKRLRLVEPDVWLETDPSGQSNVVFMSKKQEPQTVPEAPPQAGMALPALTANQVQIDRGRLVFKDGRTGTMQTVTLERMRAEGSGPQAPTQVALRGAYNEQPFTVKGTLGSLAALVDAQQPWPLTLRAAVGETTVTVDGTLQDVLHARGVTLTVAAHGPSVAALAQLAGVRHLPELGAFKVAFTAADAGDTLAIQQFDADIGSAALAHLTLVGTMRDVWAQRGLEARFTVQGQDLSRLQKFFGTTFPIQGPFAISGRTADVGPQAYEVSQLQARLPHLDVSGTVALNLAGARPQLTARLASDKVDLRPFLPQEKGNKEPQTSKDRLFSQEPVPLDGLYLADVTLAFSARQFLTPRLVLDDLTAHLVLQEGHLVVQPLQARMGGGSLHGSVTVQPRGETPQVALALKMHQVDVGRIARELHASEKLTGQLDATIDVQGKGKSVATVMAGLKGTTALVMGKGQLANEYIELLGADLATSLFRLVNPFAKEQPVTEINCLVSRFAMQDGLAQSTALVLDTRHMSVVGEGQVNLKTEGLDIALRPSPKEGAGVSGLGQVGLSLSELARPFKLGGTLAHPALTVDATQAALAVGKSIGGALLFGPVGIAAALLRGSSAGQENACLQAIEAAKTGVQPAAAKPREGLKDTVEQATEDIGTGLKKLFGR